MPKKEEQEHGDNLRELRDRLYSRGAPPEAQPRFELSDKPLEAPTAWNTEELTPQEPAVEEPITPVSMRQKRRSYRTTLLIAGLMFFVLALILSGSFLFFGRNTISGDNIAITADGPIAVGGGEELELNVSLANNNAVPIESATLIVEYPYGTQSAEEEGKELFRDRKPLDRLNPGEARSVPLRARVFGEENEEKTVRISIEYRVEGSNATFFKEAEPLRFKISSSPVVLAVDNVSQSASGQDIELKVLVSSNSPSEIADVLLKAEYPAGFEFAEAEPGTVSGRDTWSIEDLKPGEEREITVKGTLTGNEDEVKVFRFSVGVPNDRDRFSLASIFSTETEEISIEDPFLDVGVSINGDESESVAVTPGTVAQVAVTLTNTLEETIYDGAIVVDLGGNGLDDSSVSVSDGFYNSSADTVTWTANDTDALDSIAPGRSVTVTFQFTPDADYAARTPQVDFTVNAEANRVSASQVSQKLSGIVERSVKVASAVEFSSAVRYSVGAFKNSGPVPPQAEEVTTYSVRLHVKNGSNAMTEGVASMSLPAYVTWLSLTTSASTFTYNPQSREVSWKVGDLKAGEAREAEFQISVTPSVSQVGQVITLVNTQRLRATDRFTGTALRTEAAALTTELSSDPKYEQDEGRVAPKDD